jgi:hypothetical protein
MLPSTKVAQEILGTIRPRHKPPMELLQICSCRFQLNKANLVYLDRVALRVLPQVVLMTSGILSFWEVVGSLWELPGHKLIEVGVHKPKTWSTSLTQVMLQRIECLSSTTNSIEKLLFIVSSI